MKSNPRTARDAFTVVELLIVLLLAVLIAALVLPFLARSHGRSNRIGCTNYLKQVALSFRMFANDNGDQFPMTVSTNQGGSAEVATNVSRTFQVMSNELSSPSILTCPNDTSRVPAKSWAHLANSNISYFIGLEAYETNPQMLLTGDRNLTINRPVVNGVLTVATNDVVSWTRDLHQYQGNVGLADGSVQQVSSAKLQQAVRDSTTNATFRLAMP